MGDQTGAVRLPDVIDPNDYEDDPRTYRLSERVKLALDLLNTAIPTTTSGGIYYNFLQYGGVADGVTDNSAALATLLTTVTAAGGGVIYFPSGNYVFGSTITPADNSKITFLGDGESTEWRKNANGYVLCELGQQCSIRNLKINTQAFTGSIVRISTGAISNTAWRQIIDVSFVSTTSACNPIIFAAAISGYNSLVHNCRFDVPSITPIIAFAFGAAEASGRRIFSNIIGSSGSSIDLDGSFGSVLINCQVGIITALNTYVGKSYQIIGCTVNNAGTGIFFYGSNNTVVGNKFYSPSITIPSSVSNLYFSGNSSPLNSIVDNSFVTSQNHVEIPRQSYIPNFIMSAGSGYTVGNGTLIGYWTQYGDTVECTIEFQVGTTTSFGTIPAAGILFTLPNPWGVVSNLSSIVTIGTGRVTNGGALSCMLAITVPTNDKVSGYLTNNNSVLSGTNPAGLVAGDRVTYQLMYKKI